MKYPAIIVYVVRAFEHGAAGRAAQTINGGLVELNDDGGIDFEPVTVYQWNDSFDEYLQRFERHLIRYRDEVKRIFGLLNSDDRADDDDAHDIILVLHCNNPQPQAVKEIEKVLQRYFRDKDMYELVDITIKINPKKLDYDNYEQECDEFQKQLFA